MRDPARRFLVTTDDGDVVVTVNERAGGLDTDLLSFRMADAETAVGIEMATPLRAFSAKMIDIIEGQGLAGFAGGDRMRDLMMREKATADLRRIERYARDQARG